MHGQTLGLSTVLWGDMRYPLSADYLLHIIIWQVIKYPMRTTYFIELSFLKIDEFDI